MKNLKQHEIGAAARPFAGCAATYVNPAGDIAWMTHTSLSKPGSEEKAT